MGKGALRFELQGRHYSYWPALAEAECVQQQTQSFLDRVFGGSLSPMVAHLAEHGSVSADDIAALRRLLTEQQEQPDEPGKSTKTSKKTKRRPKGGRR